MAEDEDVVKIMRALLRGGAGAPAPAPLPAPAPAAPSSPPDAGGGSEPESEDGDSRDDEHEEVTDSKIISAEELASAVHQVTADRYVDTDIGDEEDEEVDDDEDDDERTIPPTVRPAPPPRPPSPPPPPPMAEARPVTDTDKRIEEALLSGKFDGLSPDEALAAMGFGISDVFRRSRLLEERIRRLGDQIQAKRALAEASGDTEGEIIRQKLDDLRRDIQSLRNFDEKLSGAVGMFVEDKMKDLKDGIQKGVDQLAHAFEARTNELANIIAHEAVELKKAEPNTVAVARVDYWGEKLKKSQYSTNLLVVGGAVVLLFFCTVFGAVLTGRHLELRNEFSALREQLVPPDVLHLKCESADSIMEMRDGTVVVKDCRPVTPQAP